MVSTSTDTAKRTDDHIKTGWGLMSVILASSVGTLIEWYDFYIYGTLAPYIAKHFFPAGNVTASYLAALGTFAAGFIVRPFGALFFGRLGDLIGRKYTFLVTLLLMGLSTFVIGLIPGYAQIGMAAPILILFLRLLQGLALGGEYGGAATYVAEHSPAHQRGYYTGYIQTTATVGLLISIAVILGTKGAVGEEPFNEWGWRLPFLISIVMVGISVYIRLKMQESPMFSKIKHSGKLSANPLKESFAKRDNLKMVLLALFGAVAGQGVIWYTGQFYAMSFMDKVCNLEFNSVRYILAVAIIFGTPFFLIFGSLSDKIGRKWIMMAGMLLGILTYRPIYQKMLDLSSVNKETVAEKSSVGSVATVDAATGDSTVVTTTVRTFVDGNTYKEVKTEKILADASKTAPKAEVKKTVWLSSGNWWFMAFLVFIQILYVTMVYGPIAAFLVELFPTRIRYTSMSLPYHIGNGIFGGLVPYIATFLVESSKTADKPSGDPLAGLFYPMIIAGVCLLIGILYMPARTDQTEHHED
ncbi:MAG: MFS transporter [Saprospiraceae bacterium]|nr:MFS transporter [Saprospiraceae bacterium]